MTSYLGIYNIGDTVRPGRPQVRLTCFPQASLDYIHLPAPLPEPHTPTRVGPRDEDVMGRPHRLLVVHSALLWGEN